jgi:hypothetical protein
MPIPIPKADNKRHQEGSDKIGRQESSHDPSGVQPSQDSTSAHGILKEEAERLYEERIEEEYAKREGGA